MSFQQDGGWGASLVNHFRRTADVVLRGYSGYNTRRALGILNMEAFPVEPLAVTVFFGANDAALPDRSSSFSHVPIEEYEQNLRSIVSFFKKQWPKVIVILLSPPPISEAARILRNPYGNNTPGLPERTNGAAGAYAQACLRVATELGVPSVDLWTKVQQVPDWETACLSDGLHLARAGNALVFAEVVEVLKKHGCGPETLSSDGF
ncbi:unnamed protein product [Cuscuta campestris]|uniref:SGNH hydrolase-type esterase domain-containing protein n=1 Tax=Cuscuta campestris TaxID=132261 RepID=A0A484MI73_9ASTE|nr:unnamed protein product [Cuscuta campestris]